MNYFFRRIISADPIKTDRITFTDLTRNMGRLLFLEAMCNIASVGGHCGVDFNPNRQNGTELFCFWNPRNEINPQLLGRPTGKPLYKLDETALRNATKTQFESVVANPQFQDTSWLQKIIRPRSEDTPSTGSD